MFHKDPQIRKAGLILDKNIMNPKASFLNQISSLSTYSTVTDNKNWNSSSIKPRWNNLTTSYDKRQIVHDFVALKNQ